VPVASVPVTPGGKGLIVTLVSVNICAYIYRCVCVFVCVCNQSGGRGGGQLNPAVFSLGFFIPTITYIYK
jgi:hypothetical protein